MTPFNPEVKKQMIEEASKAFPKKSVATLTQEFNEMLRLETSRFATETGLTRQEQKKLEKLHKQFTPRKP